MNDDIFMKYNNNVIECGVCTGSLYRYTVPSNTLVPYLVV
jgi:hypothetical protein